MLTNELENAIIDKGISNCFKYGVENMSAEEFENFWWDLSMVDRSTLTNCSNHKHNIPILHYVSNHKWEYISS